MDELKIGSGFMKSLVSRIVTKKLRKKYGSGINMQVNKLHIYTDEKNISHVSLDIKGDIPKETLEKLLDSLGIWRLKEGKVTYSLYFSERGERWLIFLTG